MFSKTVEYALRAIVHLAQHTPDAQKTSQIAESTKVPPAYLSKVLQGLQVAGLVKMQRGIGGGVSLVDSPDDLTILDIVNAVEPIERIRTCPLELKGHGTRLCALHRRMDKAIEETEKAFRSTTLAEILAEPNQSVPLVDSSVGKKRSSRKAKK